MKLLDIPMQLLLDRLVEIYEFAREPGEWAMQKCQPGAKWRTQKRALEDLDLAEMLQQQHWIASRAAKSGITTRIGVDLDAKNPDDLLQMQDRYWRVRELMGYERRPIVWHTPSGTGLRVFWRIPPTKLSELVTGRGAGLFAEVLERAGLPVVPGRIEVFPQPRQADRLPLGRRMPLLASESLLPEFGPIIGEVSDEFALEHALSILEAWASVPYEDFIEHLRQLLPASGDGSLTPEAEQLNDSRPRVVPLRRLEATDLVGAAKIATTGLTAPSTRLYALRIVGRAMLTQPEMFGLSATPSDEDVAFALAEWLSTHNNGFSADWNALMKRCGQDVAVAVAHQAREFLHPKWGLVMHLVSVVDLGDPSGRYVLGVSREEAFTVFRVAGEHTDAGADRYKLEVWLFSLIRHLKAAILRQKREGTLRTCLIHRSAYESEVAIQVEISTKWMRDWPHGDGKNSDGVASYVRYRDVALSCGLLSIHRNYQRKGHNGALRDTAIRYAVRESDLNFRLRLRDLPVAPDTALERVLAKQAMPIDITEVMHAVFASQAFCRFDELRARYKRSRAEHVRLISEMAISP